MTKKMGESVDWLEELNGLPIFVCGGKRSLSQQSARVFVLSYKEFVRRIEEGGTVSEEEIVKKWEQERVEFEKNVPSHRELFDRAMARAMA